MAWWRRARDFAVVFRRQCSVSRFNVAAAQDMHEPHRLLREFANRVTAAERRSALFRIPPRRVVAGQRPRKLRWPIALTRRALRGSPARFFDSPLSPLQRTCNRRQRGSYAHPRSCSAPSHRLSPPGSNRSRLRYTCDTEEKQPLINIAEARYFSMPSTDPADNGHGDPFPDRPPQYVRALLYEYRFADPGTYVRTGQWWVRQLEGALFPAGQPGRLPSSRAARNWAASRDRRKSLTLTARRQLRRRFAGVRRGM